MSDPRSPRKTFITLLSWIKPHSFLLVMAFLCMLTNSLIGGLPIAGVLIPFVDSILAGKPIMLSPETPVPGFVRDWVATANSMSRWKLLNFLIWWTVILAFFRLVFEYLQSILMNQVSYRVITDLRSKIYDKIIGLPLSFYGRSQTGALVSRITNDTVVVRDSISEGLTDFLFQPLQILIYAGILLFVTFTFNIPVSLLFVVFVVLPLVIYPVIRVGKRLKKYSRTTQNQVADMHSMLIETISGIRIVQGFGMEAYESARFRRANQELLKTMMGSISRMILVSPITEFVGFCCLGVVLWIGGREVIENQLSPGAFIAFLVAFLSLMRPAKRLSRVYGINQHAMAAAERVMDILETPNDIAEKLNAVEVVPFKDKIEFQNVNFEYETGKSILKNLNLTVNAGEILAIVGPSGGGKTSLVNLLPRFYDVSAGDVKIDGVSVKDANLKSLRAQIGIVTQETVLFNDTVFSNIAYGLTKISQADVEHAAKIANAHTFISKLPNKYQTVIGDRGMRLSGGEKQRLSIARAVLKNPPILILDEATSALDTESEHLVQEAIHNLMKGRTVFVIAHRLSTIRDAHRIVVIDKGGIAEIGTHDQLLAKNGLYKHLYELQFKA